MGKGPGCIPRTMSLEEYQLRVGKTVMTVNENVYTFLAGTIR